jgi:hypothetical protein
MALDAQIRQACADGLYVLLLPYRYPPVGERDGAAGARQRRGDLVHVRRPDVEAAWNKYVANGRNPAVYKPPRRALEYKVPDEGYPLDGAWSKFFDFLVRRYHWGQRASGRYVGGFELINEPNLQLWPQRAPSVTPGDPFAASGALRVPGQVAQMLATAQAVSARVRHSTGMLAPSSSDSEIVGPAGHALPGVRDRRAGCVRRDRLHAALRAVVVAPQLLRRRGAGGDARAASCATACAGAGPGGSSWRARRTCGSPRAARRPVQDEGAVSGRGPAGGAGSVPADVVGSAERRAGRLDGGASTCCKRTRTGTAGCWRQAPSTAKRPAYATWQAFPKRHVRRSVDEIEAVRRAKARLDRLGLLSLAGADRAAFAC